MIYFEVKKCPEIISCAAVGSRNRFSTAKSGIKDVCRMIEWLAEHKDLEGTFNCSSPNAMNNKTFMQVLRSVTGTKIGSPAFKWMLKIGAVIIGTEPELLLNPDFAVEIVMRVSNASELGVSGYFLADE